MEKYLCCYCGHIFELSPYNIRYYQQDETIKCPKCKDTSIKALNTGDYYGYNNTNGSGQKGDK